MKPVIPKPQRCAIYTRKSTEYNLDLAFNSLDAQREACEAYIKSQAHEGWRLSPERYDDGGLSGASLERPALQMLLERVRARKIAIIVVYKVDRLTRSLADFAKLVEIFDDHGISVTQSFNTTSSMAKSSIAARPTRGEHAPILGPGLFDAVQAKLAERAVRRKMRRSQSPSLLMGLLFDDRGNPMSPSHANKKGVRYRYYVSQSILQNRKSGAGSVSRVSGPDIEAVVVDSVRQAIIDRDVAANDHDGDRRSDGREDDRTTTKTINTTITTASPDSSRDLIGRHVARIVLRPRAIEITLSDKRDHHDASRTPVDAEQQSTDDANDLAAHSDSDTTETESSCSDIEPSIASADAKRSISIPWPPPIAWRRKGVVHLPASHDLYSRDRDALLTAIAKARSRMDDLIAGRVQSFDEIAVREQKVVRHIRFLAPLAFLSPRIVAVIANGDIPADATVSGLVRSLPFNWAEQEGRFALF